MPDLGTWGRILMFLGFSLFVFGGILIFGGKFLNLGKLPGDIYMQKGNISFYFPIATSIVLSILLSIIINLFFRK